MSCIAGVAGFAQADVDAHEWLNLGGIAVPPPPQLDGPGAAETLALAAVYPDRINAVGIRDGQFALLIGERWFSWADGRLLPDELRARAAELTPQRFYNYQRGPLVIREISAADTARLRQRSQQSAADTPPRDPQFLDALYGVGDRADADRRMVQIRFLGNRTRVHTLLVEPLQRVEAELQALIATDADAGAFVAGLRQVGGFAWRNIAGTQSRSLHSYGVAIDLIPSSYRNRFAYWRWALDAGIDDWWAVPREARWQVPPQVVDVFERHGFVWGGKWLFFDALHFEYRPEVLLLTAWSEAEP